MATSDLSIGASGAGVAALHSALSRLGYSLPPSETNRTFFGPATRQAVLQLQQRNGLPANGVVDYTTATLLQVGADPPGTSQTAAEGGTAGTPAAGSAAAPMMTGSALPESAIYNVTGTVASPDRAGVGGLSVVLVDKNVGPDVTLAGPTATDSFGRYSFSGVAISTASLRERLKDKPDLQVRVSIRDTFLAASDVRYNASTNETLNVALPPNATALPSEYETLTSALAVNYDGSLSDLQENAQRSDITYLANKTGWDARAVAMSALAAQFSQYKLTPSAGAADGGINPEFYYALFRSGLPANPVTLYFADLKTVESVWNQAIAQGVIPAALASEVPAALTSFQKLAGSRNLDAVPIPGTSSLRSLLSITLTDPLKQAQFSELYTAYRSDPQAFWEKLSAPELNFGQQTIGRLKLDGQLAFLTLNNATLIRKLYDAEKTPPLTSSLDLVCRGYYQAEKWDALLAGVPMDQVPGQGTDEKRANYTALLTAQLRLSYPTAVIGEMVNAGTMPLHVDQSVQDGVYQFLSLNQGRFELGLQPIDQYLTGSVQGSKPPAPVVAQLKRLHRCLQITPSDTAMAALLSKNIDSASAVVQYGQAAFVRDFAASMGGQDVAETTYGRALTIRNAIINVTTSYILGQVTPSLGSGARKDPGLVRQSTNAGTQTNPAASATLQTLFGNMDYCACDDCRSILGPAAYFVDLLNFINITPADPTTQANPQTVLFARRPDLQWLPLTCENTNIALPYIDLVNETLEYFAANGSIFGYQGYNTDGTVSSDELLASPQNINLAAYAMLQSTHFPPPLPFHRSLELLRRLFKQFNVNLQDAMATLRQGDALERSATTPYAWRDILMEQLGLSRPEYRLLADSTMSLAEIYGYPRGQADGVTIQNLSSLTTYSSLTGVSYDDLVAILQTQFVNPSACLVPALQSLNVPFTTIQTLYNSDTPANIAAFEALLATPPAAPNPADFGGTTNADIVAWLIKPDNYAKIMHLIVIANPSNPSDLCSIGELTFCYSDPSLSPNQLDPVDFLRLLRFIRLWRKLTTIFSSSQDAISQLDNLIAALSPALPAVDGPTITVTVLNPSGLVPSGIALTGTVDMGAAGQRPWRYTTGTHANIDSVAAGIATELNKVPARTFVAVAVKSVVHLRAKTAIESQALSVIARGAGQVNLTVTTSSMIGAEFLDHMFLFLLPRIGFAYRVLAMLGLDPSNDLPQLLACWAPIGTFGAHSLYASMFLTPRLLQQDPAFAADAGGQVLLDTTQFVLAHEPALRGAFNLTGAEFLAITNALNLNATTNLNVESISEIFRRGWLARTLGISVIELLSLIQYTNLDPFAFPDPSPMPPTEPDIIRFIRLVQSLSSASLPPVQALYLMWNNDITGTLTPPLSDVLGLAFTLRSDFAAVASQFALVADPTGNIANGLMALVYGTAATDFFFGLLNNTFSTSVPYANPSSAQSMLAAAIAAAPGRLTYDDLAKQLTYAGFLDVATQNAINSAIAGSASNASPSAASALEAAVANLYAVGQTTIAPFFATYPELLPLFTAYAASTDPPQTKRSALLANIIPVLQRQRNLEQALAAITGAAGTDPSFAKGLLDDPTVLYSATNSALPIIEDFMAMDTPGLAAQFSLPSGSGGPVLTISDNTSELSYAPAVLVTTETASFVGLNTVGATVTTIINGQEIGYQLVSEDTDEATLVSHIAEAINSASSITDPVSGLPVNSVVTATTSPTVISISPATPGNVVTLTCSVSPAATGSYTAAGPGPVWLATVAGNFVLNDVLTTTVNGVSVSHTVVQADIIVPPYASTAILASRIQSQLTTTTTPTKSTLPLNTMVSASSSGAVVEIAPITAGATVALACSASSAATGSYATGASPAWTAEGPVWQATIAGSFTEGDVLYTTINGGTVAYPVVTADVADATQATLAGHVAGAINAATVAIPLTPNDGTAILPLNEAITTRVDFGVTIEAVNSGASLLLECAPTLVATPSYAAGTPVPASQTATVVGPTTAKDVLTTTVNGVPIPCTVAAGDTSEALLASHIASVINATTAPDSNTGLPLNRVVSASANAGVITITAINFGPAVTVTCDVSASATETYTPGIPQPASQTATVVGAIVVNDVVTTTINGVTVPYTIVASNATVEDVADGIMAAINGTTTLDKSTNQPLNSIVSATSSPGGVVTVAAVNPGVSFTVTCSVSLGTYDTTATFPAAQTAIVSGGITPGDLLVTTINGADLAYQVAGPVAGGDPGDTNVTDLAANIVALIKATQIQDPATGLRLSQIVSAWSAGGVITVASLNGAPFALTCRVSPGATETYVTGPQFPALQAAVSGGFADGDVLTTTVNGVPIPYQVRTTGISKETLATYIVAAVNGAAQNVVKASSNGNIITFKMAGSAFTLGYGLSTNATGTCRVPGILPANASGNAITGTWSGYLSVPQDGYYNICVETDAGATVALEIGGTVVTMAPSSNTSVWSNQSPISLTAGTLSTIALNVLSLTTSMTVNWESAGSGWQPIPDSCLYSYTLVRNLQAAYTVFIRATSLAAALSLTADEIAYLATGPDSQIDGQAWLNVPPASQNWSQLRDILNAILDFARLKAALSPNDERVLETLQTLSTSPAAGSTALIAVTGWDPLSLNPLLQHFWGSSDPSVLSHVVNLTRVSEAYALVKTSGVSATALLSATTNEPGVSTVDSTDSLGTGSNIVFTPASMANIIPGAALIVGTGAAQEQLTVTAITATTFSAATTKPHNGTDYPFSIVGASDVVGAFEAALRARYAESDWLGVIKPINNTLRELQRGALVAYVLQTLSDAPPVVDIDTPVNTADTLYEYLLMDVQMDACMETSRIRLALSAVQLFIERCRRGLEANNTDPTKNISPSIFTSVASQWTWMKRYRVWQANREVFLWPENWLYPELRDDQSPIFKTIMSQLLQNDITDDGATSAYLDYLSNLEAIAKLDPCAICYVPDAPGGSPSVHVVARSTGATRTYYYRSFNGTWTSWDEIKVKIEDNPIVLVVWNSRLLLFWLQLIQQGSAGSGGNVAASGKSLGDATFKDLQSFAGDSLATQTVTVAFNLCWSEYYAGKWQPAKTSDTTQPAVLGNYSTGGQGAFDRSALNFTGYPDEYGKTARLWLEFDDHVNFASFAFYNTHSSPVPSPAGWDKAWQSAQYSPYTCQVSLEGSAVDSYAGISISGPPESIVLTVNYFNASTMTTIPADFDNYLFYNKFSGIPMFTASPQYVADGASGPGWTPPFLYADTLNVLYIAPTVQPASRETIYQHYGLSLPVHPAARQIPALIVDEPPQPVEAGNFPVAGVQQSVGISNPNPISRYVATSPYISRGLGTTGAVRFDGQEIGPSGAIAT